MAIVGSGSGGNLPILTFKISQTYTPSYTSEVIAYVIGGGGSGAATERHSSYWRCFASGGGAGGTAISRLILTSGVNYTITIGAGGASVSETYNATVEAGNAGGASSLSGSDISTMTANGGQGGAGSITASATVADRTGGSASGGNIANFTGGSAKGVTSLASQVAASGGGGVTLYGATTAASAFFSQGGGGYHASGGTYMGTHVEVTGSLPYSEGTNSNTGFERAPQLKSLGEVSPFPFVLTNSVMTEYNSASPSGAFGFAGALANRRTSSTTPYANGPFVGGSAYGQSSTTVAGSGCFGSGGGGAAGQDCTSGAGGNGVVIFITQHM